MPESVEFGNCFMDVAGKGPVVSKREGEVLYWVKEGKTSGDISMILGITERTVNFHIYNIMEKLGVVNRPQMIAVAAQLGLICVSTSTH